MRVHQLQVQAFGPFAGRENINFDVFGTAGLFLLNGETGAGKTSVLDALCFGLYGQLPGARRGTRSIRSSHAEDALAPEVRLEFSVRTRRFEITRSPSWDRPKKRGTGTTSQQAQARLREWVDDAWQVKSTRNDEVAAEIHRIIGMNLEQFTRVAMLPQGEFARFLRAEDTDRHKLLESLFDVSEYRAVEGWFVDRRRTLAERAREAAAERRHLIESMVSDADASSFTDTSAAARPDPEAAPTDAEQTLEEIASALARSADQVKNATTAAATRREAASSARESIRQRRQDAADVARWRQAQAQHEAAAEAVTQRRQELEGDARAGRVLDAVERLRGAAAALDNGREHEASARARAEQHAVAAGFLRDGDDAALRTASVARSAAEQERASAAALLPVEREQQQLALDLAETQERVARLDRQLADAQELAAAAARRAESAQAEVTAQSEVLERDPDAEQNVRAAAERLRAAEEREAHADEHARITAEWVEQTTAHADALKRHARLVAARLGQAALALAADLSPGVPCAVCGATEHPAPARAEHSDDVVTDHEVESAQERVQALARTSDAAAQARASADARQQQLSERAGGESLAALTEQHERAQQRLTVVEGAQRALATARRDLQEAAKAEKTAQQSEAATREQRAAVTTRAQQLQVSVEQADRRLLEASAGAETLTQRVSQLQEAVDLLDRWRQAVDALEHLQEHERASRREVDTALDDAGFASVDEATAARLEDAERAAATASVRDFEREATRVATLAENDSVRRGVADEEAGRSVPNDAEEQQAQTAFEQAEEIYRDLLTEQGQLEGHARRFASQRECLGELERRTGPLIEEYELIKTLADTMTGAGENRYRMTLSTYVLAARLEAVAAAANERLEAMTDGRFRLVHDDASAGRSKGGLGLKVVDAWTGQRRETGTLSGGESFMASLALALGLADVVQAESGGVDMETLFVDEGFGTLDPLTLERVMAALDGLRASGRMVGIVSHVNELKEQVAAQLIVSKGRNGSTVQVSIGAEIA
ncbi:AAA family ATPase [Zhihengliuella flava]|uniref:Nuclease SbcCD subunit C n=1 Tax=Zhihengliuella flava TaxID=1285193 RepID=A0A931D3A4_9MICC|nr:SMC family ATPase [Zhihengliuella flava]MBG6083609.1 exonuclease SbcC [Zhihengliuella flava]